VLEYGQAVDETELGFKTGRSVKLVFVKGDHQVWAGDFWPIRIC